MPSGNSNSVRSSSEASDRAEVQSTALLHESSRARRMPTDRILTCRCGTTLVGRGRSSDSRSHSIHVFKLTVSQPVRPEFPILSLGMQALLSDHCAARAVSRRGRVRRRQPPPDV